jgi:transposase InsO family protein
LQSAFSKHALNFLGEENFLADSGATAHVCNNRKLMHDFTPTPNENASILTGAGPLPVEGRGTCIVIDPSTNLTFTLHNCLYVPSSPLNIYSTTQLNEEGGTFLTTKTHAILTDRAGRTIITSKHYRHLYLLQGVYPDTTETLEVQMNAYFNANLNIPTPDEPADASIWHKRFGHPARNTLQRIKALKCVNGMMVESDLTPHQCLGCVTGKFRRSPFPSDEKLYKPLELVHSDISGDYPRALNGHRYFTTLRDHATGFTLVATHAHKHEAADFLKNSILKLERETQLKVKSLRTDRGSEYMSKKTQQWLRDQGITHLLTTVESSASNGVAERVNLTLMNRVRATLVETNQPRLLWPWALQHVAHASNFIPSSTQRITPHELLYGTAPDVSHLRAFGAAVATWTPTSRRVDKLVPTADVGRFMGYTASKRIHQV